MADATGAVRAKPLSPHMTIWRFHLTMYASIINRAAGCALYGGALIVAWGAVALAMGPQAYGDFLLVAGSIVGKLALFGLTLSFFYHLAAGIRHLVFDAGHGFSPRAATMSAVVSFTFAVVASLAVWALAYATGGAR